MDIVISSVLQGVFLGMLLWVFWVTQEKGNFHAYALWHNKHELLLILLNLKRSVLKKNIYKERADFPFTAILHSWTRIPQVFFWIITNCITDVNLPWQQLNRCKVWYHFYATTLLCTFAMYEYKQKRNQTSEPTQYSMTTSVSKWSLSIV